MGVGLEPQSKRMALEGPLQGTSVSIMSVLLKDHFGGDGWRGPSGREEAGWEPCSGPG